MIHEILSGLHLPEKKATSKFIKNTLLCSTLAFSVSACSPKEQSYLFGSNIDMGGLPTDICKIDNKPQVLNVSTESNGDIGLIYIRNNGDLVSQHYGRDRMGIGTQYAKVGEFVWKGDACPTAPAKK
jgi:hypothetical protein